MPNEGDRDEAVRPTERADALPVERRERPGDARLILVMRGLRSLAYGLLAVILGVVLEGEGFSPAAIGVLITVSLVGDMVGTYLIGLVAEDAKGDPIGTVIAVHDFGAGDLLEIVPQGGGETRLLPFTAAVVPQVDIAAGRIVLDPPVEIEPDAGEPQPGDG